MEESDSLSQEEQHILNNLQQLERFSTSRDSDPLQIKEMERIIIQTINWMAESIEASDVDLPLQIMDLLEYLDKVRGLIIRKMTFRQNCRTRESAI
jgi:hypothetical protein